MFNKKFRLQLPIEVNGEEVWLGVNYEFDPFRERYNVFEIYSEDELEHFEGIESVVMAYLDSMDKSIP